jgi:hypothetical protein
MATKTIISVSLVALITLSLFAFAQSQPSADSQCASAISQIISRTYPNETALILYSGKGAPKTNRNRPFSQISQLLHVFNQAHVIWETMMNVKQLMVHTTVFLAFTIATS